MAAIAFSSSPFVLAAAVLLAGMSTGLASPPLAESVAARVTSERQGRANTLINSGTSVGVALSGPVALTYGGAWREAYLLFAGIAACVSLWVWLALPARGPAAAVAPDLSLKALKRPAALPLILAAFGMGAASAVYWTFAGEVMSEVGGLSRARVSTVWIVIGLAGLAGGAAGNLVRRFGISAVNRAALTVLASAIMLTGLLPDRSALVYGAAALFGGAYISLTGIYLVWGVRVFPDRPAVGLGLPFLMIAIGQVAGAPVAGGVIDLLGYAAAFAGFAGIALVTMRFVPLPTDAPADQVGLTSARETG